MATIDSAAEMETAPGEGTTDEPLVAEEEAVLHTMRRASAGLQLWDETTIVLADLLQSEGRKAEAKRLTETACPGRERRLSKANLAYLDRLGVCDCIPWPPQPGKH